MTAISAIEDSNPKNAKCGKTVELENNYLRTKYLQSI